jgi:hypothetical protein
MWFVQLLVEPSSWSGPSNRGRSVLVNLEALCWQLTVQKIMEFSSGGAKNVEALKKYCENAEVSKKYRED